MGASASKNVSRSTVNAVASIASSIIATQTLDSDQTQIISISDVVGDVKINGNIQTQKANVNLKGLMDAFSSQAVAQDVTNAITQSAKSLVSGLNLAQVSIAENQIENYVSATLDMTNNIAQTCSSLVSQEQEITVSNVLGNVEILDNTQEQSAKIFQKCIQTATNEMSAVQSLQNTLDQSASATSQGLSEWALALMALIPIIMIVLPVAVGGVVVMNMILLILFIIMFVAGIVMIILFFMIPEETMLSVTYSKGIADGCGPSGAQVSNPVVLDSSTDTEVSNNNAQVLSFEKLASDCLADPNCVAVDWKGSIVNPDGSLTVLPQPIATTYSGLRENPCQVTLDDLDDTSLVRYPNIQAGPDVPSSEQSQNGKEGDVYIRTSNADYYIFEVGSGFQLQTVRFFESASPLTGLVLGSGDPTEETAQTFYVNTNFTSEIKLWKFGTSADIVPGSSVEVDEDEEDIPRWLVISTIPGPGGISEVPESLNGSAFKTKPKFAWLIGIGIVLMIVGIGGFIAMMFMKKNKKGQTQKKDSGSTSKVSSNSKNPPVSPSV